jgi:hypothetical protein
MNITDYTASADEIVHRAVDVLPSLSNKDPRVAAVAAAVELAQNRLAGALEEAICAAVDGVTAVDGDREELGADFQSLIETGVLASPLFKAAAEMDLAIEVRAFVVTTRMDEPGMAGAVAEAIAARIAPKWAPHHLHRGKWLAKLGVVAEHLERIGAGVEEPLIEETVEFFEESAPIDPAAWNNLNVAPAPDLQLQGPPSTDELRTAYNAVDGSIFRSPGGLTEALGISKMTWDNWSRHGRGKPKCTVEQARLILAHIDESRMLLGQAELIFSRCR